MHRIIMFRFYHKSSSSMGVLTRRRRGGGEEGVVVGVWLPFFSKSNLFIIFQEVHLLEQKWIFQESLYFLIEQMLIFSREALSSPRTHTIFEENLSSPRTHAIFQETPMLDGIPVCFFYAAFREGEL